MNKELTIKVQNKLDMFKAYLASINWTMGKNSLTESEIEVLALLMYYNNVYKEITDNQVRSDLLLSNVVKKKMKDEFGISSSKLETYLGKLRKKGLITTMLNPKFMIYPDNLLSIKFSFVYQPVTYTPQEEVPQITTEEPPVYEPVQEEIVSQNFQEWTPDYEE
jgi:hypothetical protein